MDRDKKAPVLKIDDVNVTWQSIIDDSQDKLIGKQTSFSWSMSSFTMWVIFNLYIYILVIDCHQEWCGPCDAIGPTLQRLYLDFDHGDERIALATISYTCDQSAQGGPPCGVSPLGEKLQAIIPAAAKLKLENHGCLPLFLCVRVSGSSCYVFTSALCTASLYFSTNLLILILNH